jgi:hypothetical protein
VLFVCVRCACAVAEPAGYQPAFNLRTPASLHTCHPPPPRKRSTPLPPTPSAGDVKPSADYHLRQPFISRNRSDLFPPLPYPPPFSDTTTAGDDKPSHTTTPTQDISTSAHSPDTPAASGPPAGGLQSGAVDSGPAATGSTGSEGGVGLGAVLQQGWEDLKHGGAKAPQAVSVGVSGDGHFPSRKWGVAASEYSFGVGCCNIRVQLWRGVLQHPSAALAWGVAASEYSFGVGCCNIRVQLWRGVLQHPSTALAWGVAASEYSFGVGCCSIRVQLWRGVLSLKCHEL